MHFCILFVSCESLGIGMSQRNILMVATIKEKTSILVSGYQPKRLKFV